VDIDPLLKEGPSDFQTATFGRSIDDCSPSLLNLKFAIYLLYLPLWSSKRLDSAAIRGTFLEVHLSRTKLFTDLIRGYTTEDSIRVRIERRLKMELPPKARGEDGSESEGDW